MMEKFLPLWVALVTPFKQNDMLDEVSLTSFLKWHIQQSKIGFLACGSTGEGSRLSLEERQRVLNIVKNAQEDTRPLMAGVTGQTVDETLSFARQAEALAYDFLLIAPPSYVRPTQEALIEYFSMLHQETNTPLLLYDHPGRTGVGLADKTVISLARLPRIVGLKDATGDPMRPFRLRSHVDHKFVLYAGDDGLAPLYMAAGAHGLISVTANLVPKMLWSFLSAFKKGDIKTFSRLRDALHPLHTALTLQGNPVTVKYALSLWNQCSLFVRDPLRPFCEEKCEKQAAELKKALSTFAFNSQ